MIATETLYGLNIATLDADYQADDPETIWSIKFYPSNILDRCHLKFNTGGGEIITILRNSISIDPVIEYFPPNFRAKVCFDFSASTITTPANARIVIIYRR